MLKASRTGGIKRMQATKSACQATEPASNHLTRGQNGSQLTSKLSNSFGFSLKSNISRETASLRRRPCSGPLRALDQVGTFIVGQRPVRRNRRLLIEVSTTRVSGWVKHSTNFSYFTDPS